MSKTRIILVGPAAVGKSSLLRRLVRDFETTEYSPTVGAEIYGWSGAMLYDTAGAERFRILIDAYIRNITAVVYVFDLSSSESLKEIQEVWRPRCGGNAEVEILLGNKSDLQRAELDFDPDDWDYYAELGPDSNLNIVFQQIIDMCQDHEASTVLLTRTEDEKKSRWCCLL